MIHMMGGHHGGFGFPFFGGGLMLLWLIPFLIIAYLVYRDANNRGMNGLLWGGSSSSSRSWDLCF